MAGIAWKLRQSIQSFSLLKRWVSLRWYERWVVITAVLIILLALLAWFYGVHSVDRAAAIAEPMFLGLGAVSLILLWAQLRAATNQDNAANIWKRVVCLHEHFGEVPRAEYAEALRRYLHELGIREPPNAYCPLEPEIVERIWADQGTDSRPPGSVLIRRYLNDWEEFCGAIKVGMIDEAYAQAMEGSRVIDAFFGYRASIDKSRHSQSEIRKTKPTALSALPFMNKYYIELQTIATKWHLVRMSELAQQQALIEKGDQAADEARRKFQDLAHTVGSGVPLRVRNTD